MIKKLEDIQRDVRVAMDMNQTDTGLLGVEDAETLELDEMIRAKVLDAVRLVHMSAPVEMLEGGHKLTNVVLSGGSATPVNPGDLASGSLTEDVLYNTDAGAVGSTTTTKPKETVKILHDGFSTGCGLVELPSDFMRLVHFKFSSWAYGVTAPVEEGSAQHRMMSSPVASVRGTWDRPKLALVRRNSGMYLQFSGCKKDDEYIQDSAYIPLPKFDSEGGVDVSERCYPAIVEQTAALVLATIGDARAATHAEIAKSLMKGGQVEMPQASVQGE